MEALVLEEFVKAFWPALVLLLVGFVVIFERLGSILWTLRSIDASLKALPGVREAEKRGEIRRIA